jgi:hypothetical protein
VALSPFSDASVSFVRRGEGGGGRVSVSGDRMPVFTLSYTKSLHGTEDACIFWVDMSFFFISK